MPAARSQQGSWARAQMPSLWPRWLGTLRCATGFGAPDSLGSWPPLLGPLAPILLLRGTPSLLIGLPRLALAVVIRLAGALLSLLALLAFAFGPRRLARRWHRATRDLLEQNAGPREQLQPTLQRCAPRGAPGRASN